jgi:tetratricopeptide (TPR) repeat protein
MLNQFEDAKTSLKQSLDIAQKFDHLQLFGLGTGYLGQVYRDCGRFNQARLTFDQSQVYANNVDTPEAKFSWQIRLSFVHLHLGQYDEAVACVNRVLALGPELTFPALIASTIILSGSVDLIRGENKEALRKFEKAAPFNSGILNVIYGDDGSLANPGIAFLQLGLVKKARRQFTKALESAISAHRQVNLLFALTGVALMLAKVGEVEQAVELYSLASRYPFVGNSRWFEDVAGREIKTAGQTLPIDKADTAKARGKQRDLWGTATELLSELVEPS